MLSHCRWTWFDRSTGLLKSFCADLLTEANVAHSSVAQDSLFIYFTDPKLPIPCRWAKKQKGSWSGWPTAPMRELALFVIGHTLSNTSAQKITRRCWWLPKTVYVTGLKSVESGPVLQHHRMLPLLWMMMWWKFCKPCLTCLCPTETCDGTWPNQAVAAALTSRWSEEYEIRAWCVQCMQQAAGLCWLC